jgi:hypothetical protein
LPELIFWTVAVPDAYVFGEGPRAISRKHNVMTTLKDEEIQAIAKQVADANNVPIQAISTTATLDSSGLPAVSVTFSIAPGTSFDFFKDGRSSRMVSDVIKLVTDTGEERLPIVHFEVTRASGS